MLKIAVLVSGGGTDLQSIIDAIAAGRLKAKIELVIADRAGIFALQRAKDNGIKTQVLKKGADEDLVNLLRGRVDLIVLAGYLSILKGAILDEFKDRIINIHPSLIPAFCGPGMYGLKVHKAVIESGVKISGCTVHFVNKAVDGGAIICQETVPVYFEDTPETLQKRVLEKEHLILPKTIALIGENKVKICGKKVKIEE